MSNNRRYGSGIAAQTRRNSGGWLITKIDNELKSRLARHLYKNEDSIYNPLESNKNFTETCICLV
jgi:hypothetical protein